MGVPPATDASILPVLSLLHNILDELKDSDIELATLMSTESAATHPVPKSSTVTLYVPAASRMRSSESSLSPTPSLSQSIS